MLTREQRAYRRYKRAIEENDTEHQFKYYLKWLHLNRHFKEFHKRERKRKKEFIKWFKKEYVPYGPCIEELLLKIVDYQADYWLRREGMAASDEYLDKIIAEVATAKNIAMEVREKEETMYTGKMSIEEEKKKYEDYHNAVLKLFNYVGDHSHNWSD